MTTTLLYRYKDAKGGTIVSPRQPNEEYQLMYRIIADEGKGITNGQIVTTVIDVSSTEGWIDCEIEQQASDTPDEPEVSEYEIAAKILLGEEE